MASHSNKHFDEYEFRLDIDIPQGVLCNEHNRTPELSLNEPNPAIETHSNNSPNDTSVESENQSSGDENDPMQDELHDTHNDDEMPYEIVDIQARENLPHYPIDNKVFEAHETDVNWKKEHMGIGSSCGPFLSYSSTIIDLTRPTPELFFNQLFDNRMCPSIRSLDTAFAFTFPFTLRRCFGGSHRCCMGCSSSDSLSELITMWPLYCTVGVCFPREVPGAFTLPLGANLLP